jgi:5'-3' exonuclease
MSNNIIFIDGSYFCFYRYHSLLTWWKNAYPEVPIDIPHQNTDFVAKFRKTFVDSLIHCKKKLGLKNDDNVTMFVGKDCPRTDIWRMKLFPSYKSNRKDDANIGPFFKIAYDENLFLQGGVKGYLSHPHLEADDCIALAAKKLPENTSIYIITSDRDYLQLSSNNIHLYTLSYKNFTGDPKKDLFIKIVMGDKSDCIPSIGKKIGPKTALKLYENPELFNKLLEDPNVKTTYELNKQLIDFTMIPQNFIDEFLHNHLFL